MYVEFFGPPGSGKSTIYSKLIKKSTYYGNPNENTTHRLHTKKELFKYSRFYQIAPYYSRHFFKSYIEWQFRHSMFLKFVAENPDFLELLVEVLYRTNHETVNSLSKLKGTVEQYQIAHDTAKDSETIIIDEGFAQKAFAILLRVVNQDFPIKKFFETTPNPEIIFYIDAPVEVCVERQRSRGKYLYQSKDWVAKDPLSLQKDLSEICSTIIEVANSYSTVIYVENTRDIESVATTIDTEIKDRLHKKINSKFNTK